MNTTDSYDFLIFIGRFQPFHLGHLKVVREGLRQGGQLIVLIGSAHAARNIRNPWSYAERETMLRGALSEEENRRLRVAPLMDVTYNDEAWVRNVQATVDGLVTAHHSQPHRRPRIGLIGHSKDHTAYYLKLFPQWGSVAVDNYRAISATAIRETYFGADAADAPLAESLRSMLPDNVQQTLQDFRQSDTYREICEELAFVARYRAGWAGSPYPPTFVTVDAVVVQSGHVLLVERKARPGKGQLALPGGFVRQHERLVEACLRELREETRLKIPAPVLRGHIKAQQVFDDPNRSTRGRTFTHAFYIELEPDKALPKVKGGDDARHALWVPLAELDPGRLYEDHYFIIQEMIGA